MKAITVWQPWATLIAIRAKPYEFRGWMPPRAFIGQRIAIHAGARPVRRSEIQTLLHQLDNPSAFGIPCLINGFARPLLSELFKDPTAVPLSHVVCTAILGEPKSGADCAREFGPDHGNDSDREGTFNWGWPLTDVLPLAPPIPYRGAQGFWNWTE